MSDKSLDELWNEVMSIAYNNSGGPEVLFRGVTDESYKLIPSIGRDTQEHTNGDIESLEGDLLAEFKRLTVPILKTSPKSEFEWLFKAQHYGLPTRLLDWSSNPLVGLFFAAEQNDQKNGVIYYLQHAVTDQYHLIDYRTADYKKEEKAKPVSVFALQPNQGKVMFVRPRYSDERYVNQRSILSCQKNPFEALHLQNIKKIIIPNAWKGEIRKRLCTMGVSTSFIYPGLAGAASEIKSLMFNPVASGKVNIVTLRAKLKLD